MTVNPYEPSAGSEVDTTRPIWLTNWNILVGLAVAGVPVLAVFLAHFHYSRLIAIDSPRSDAWLVFSTCTANDWAILAGVALVLLSLSTAPLHRRPWITRSVAIATCLLISLDFGMLQYRLAFEHSRRALTFAAFMPTLIVLGCGIPHFVSVLWRWLTWDRNAHADG